MGLLNSIGQNVGSWAGGGYGTAAQAANASLGLGTLATGATAAGSLFSGIEGYQGARFAGSIAGNNATAALQAGQTAEEESKLRTGFTTAAQTASAASRGVAAKSGSPASVVSSTQTIGALDAALIHYNAAREAFGQKEQETLDQRAGSNELIKGITGTATSLVGGANSLADKWLTYQLSGARTGTGSMTLPQSLAEGAT